MFGLLLRAFDRCTVKVDADELGIGKRFRHQDGGCSVPATHVGHFRSALQFFDDTVE
jgi:hypothetical protein